MGFDDCRSAFVRARVVLEPGLTAGEVRRIEARYGFRFPPDYCALLMDMLPVSHGFVDWRHAEEASILFWLSRPYESICSDIEYAHFWLAAWGPRPVQLADALAVAKRALDQAPTLVPVRAQSYIPDAPEEVGNPLFTVSQSEVVYDRRGLAEYLEDEFARRATARKHRDGGPVKHIGFWSDLERGVDLVFGDDKERKGP